MKKFILTVVALLTVMTSAFAQIGSLSNDLVFTPITPCRIVDTRNAGGAIVGGSPSAPNPRVFKGWAPNYTAQGGSATNCGLPQTSDIAALSVNLVVVGTAGDGWIAAYPVGASLPVVSNLNYLAGAVLANSAILKINQTTNDWNLFSTQNTHFVADVTGYYSKPVATALQCVEMTASETLVAGTSATLGTAVCPAGYSITGGSCGSSLLDQARIMSSKSIGVGTAFQSHSCTLKNEGTSILTFTASAICCRIPGR